MLDAEQRLNMAIGVDEDTATKEIFVTGKCYYKIDELQQLQEAAIKTVISDPIESRWESTSRC